MSAKSKEKTAKALIELLQPAGNVLQIHEKSGLISSLIQQHPVKKHVLIEPDQTVDNPKVTVINKPWKQALEGLGVFDAILFDRSWEDLLPPIPEQKRGLAAMALQKEKELIAMVQKELPQLSQMKYSDEDLQTFCVQLEQMSRKHLPRFLLQLKQQGQITQAQYDKVMDQYGLGKEKGSSAVSPRDDLVFQVVIRCLEHHMGKGSRFVCLLNQSNFESPAFFEEIITNPFIEYQEKWIGEEEPMLAMIVKKVFS